MNASRTADSIASGAPTERDGAGTERRSRRRHPRLRGHHTERTLKRALGLEGRARDVTDPATCLAEKRTPATYTAGNCVATAGNDAQATEETRT